MGKFSDWLNTYLRLRKTEREWRDKTDFQAIRAFWLSIASTLSAFIGIGLHTLGASATVTVVATFGLSAILLPTAFLISSRHWNQRQRKLADPGNSFDFKRYLSDQLEIKLKQIDRLPIGTIKKEALVLKVYKKYEQQIQNIEDQIAEGGLVPLNRSEVEGQLAMIQRNLIEK